MKKGEDKNLELQQEMAKALTLIYGIGANHRFTELPNANTKEEKTKVYGELIMKSHEHLIQVANAVRPIQEGDTFYDIGSGFGKVCLHWLCRSKITKAVGIEIDGSRHFLAGALWERLKDMDIFKGKEFENILGGLQEHSNFGHYAYFNNVMFPDEWNSYVWDNLLNDTVLIAFKSIPKIKPLHELKIESTWQVDTTIRIYYKK